MERDEQVLVRDAIAAILQKSSPSQVVPTLIAQGWDEMRADDEAFVLGALFECAGATLTTAPLLDLVTGHRPVLPLPGSSTAAQRQGGDLCVEGVLLGGRSDPVVAGLDDGAWVLDVDALEVEPAQGLDPELGLAVVRGSVRLDDIDRRHEAGLSTIRPLLRRCLAHELVGLAESTADLVREYAMTREQFARPLGSWQTVQHRLADVHVEIAGARSALDAAWRDEHEIVTTAAKRQAALAALAAVTHSQQIFGAIGFTAEHELHRRVRRCYVLDALLGSADELAFEIGNQLLSGQEAVGAYVDI